MNHKVNNVGQLHESAMTLYNNVVVGGDCSADSILYNLNQGIENLKVNWKGMDAGLRIQEVIGVYNGMVSVRNALAKLAIASSKTAADYREIQIANGARNETLTVLTDEPKTVLGEYTDTNDTVDINQAAEAGKNSIDTANNSIDSFASMVKGKYDEIMENWTAGAGRDVAVNAYETFLSNLNQYKSVLSNASQNITKALQNYTF